jgi:hypothetical protein
VVSPLENPFSTVPQKSVVFPKKGMLTYLWDGG